MVFVFEQVHTVPSENDPIQMHEPNAFHHWNSIHIKMAFWSEWCQENIIFQYLNKSVF
jgi:hypothetical protein